MGSGKKMTTTLYFGDMVPPRPEAKARCRNVLVGTATALEIDVREIEYDVTPPGAACVATFYNDKIIGRCAIPPESVRHFIEMDLFSDPVTLALNVTEGGPGIEGSLLALVRLPLRSVREPDEPWRASVPGAGFDSAAVEEDAGSPERQLAGIFLGEVVRFESDRQAPGSLLREAADMLASLINGRVDDIAERLIEDLAGPLGG